MSAYNVIRWIRKKQNFKFSRVIKYASVEQSTNSTVLQTNISRIPETFSSKKQKYEHIRVEKKASVNVQALIRPGVLRTLMVVAP